MNPEQMNNDQLKREIEEALSVEPSPQFASRVRARTEALRPSTAWIRWGTAGVGVALAALVMAVVVRQPKETPPPALVKAVRAVQTATPPAEEVPAIPRQPKARPLPPKTNEPEVLIDPRSIAAFRKFVDGVRKDRINGAELVLDQQQQHAQIDEIALMPMDALMPLMIEPLASESPTRGRSEGGNL